MASTLNPILAAHLLGLPRPHGRPSALLTQSRNALALEIGLLAVQSLHDELVLYPKPGLVSPFDNGSHDDMDASTFMRSLFALRHYFVRIAGAGADAAGFDELKRLGIAAEKSMLAATAGINTHRGAIFCIGMLCAAIGYCRARGVAPSSDAIRAALLAQWGRELAMHSQPGNAVSHGQKVAANFQVGGAREEVAQGLPSVFEVALPVLRSTLAAGRGWTCARIDALFALMAWISDTNVYHRAGPAGAGTVRSMAREFIACGGTAAAGWRERAVECHGVFVDLRISPGGAADLLAATCLVHKAASAGLE